MSVPLIAGPLRLEYDAGDIRCVRLGGEEILRRVYIAFQDRNWTARPWRILSEDIDDRGDSFTVRVRAEGTFDAEPFTWALEIDGRADGSLTYAWTGESRAPFLRNRLGICVLHPMAGFAGRPCEITHPDGSVEASTFPQAISPHQPFADISAMAYPIGDGGRARLDFTGEVFETEDHRNWSDASYKTYCTPISLPFPVEVRAGDVIAQAVTLTVSGVPLRLPEPPTAHPVEIAVSPAAQPLPGIGLRVTEPAWTPAEIDFLRSLGVGHLLADIDADRPDAGERIRDASDRARALDTRLFIALHASGDPDAGLAAALADVGDILAGIWIFSSEEKVTARATIDAWRSRIGPDLPWGCGTNLYFTELNRQPPDTTGLEWTTFSTNPQVHASDDRSVLQNAATLAVIAGDVPRLSGSTRVHVGPVSLRPRFNPNATDPASDVSSTDLPADVDARQRTWLAAAWCALALRGLSTSGTVHAVTIYDDLGWKGLRARDAGREDAAFASEPGEAFPVADVMRVLAHADRILPTTSSDPEAVDAVVVERGGSLQAIVVNLTDEPREARLVGVAHAGVALAPHDVKLIDLPGRAS